ncbi:MAG TPA: hypothetical protein VI121_10900, partial [Agromyces sp.]
MTAQQPVPGTQTGLVAGEINEMTDASTRAVAASAGGSAGRPMTPTGPRRPFNFGRWFRATGWRH